MNKTISVNSQLGFTLLEAMIALVVLSVGLLGLAALQARSMQYNSEAMTRSQATVIANEIIDRMRSRTYDLAGAQAENAAESYLAAAAATDCASPPVTAQQEKGCWLKSMKDYLPGQSTPTGTITRVVGTDNGIATDDVYQVRVQWVDRRRQPTDPLYTISQDFAFQP
jgi:type IV pilus assembly protein PilV